MRTCELSYDYPRGPMKKILCFPVLFVQSVNRMSPPSPFRHACSENEKRGKERKEKGIGQLLATNADG